MSRYTQNLVLEFMLRTDCTGPLKIKQKEEIVRRLPTDTF